MSGRPNADGLSVNGRGYAYDIVYDGGQTLPWSLEGHDVKEAEYRDRLSKADARYARMLGLLVGAIGTPMLSR